MDWFADQPTVTGYNPLLEMFWDPGIWRTPAHDRVVLLLSWLVTTLYCQFVLFAFQNVCHRKVPSENSHPARGRCHVRCAITGLRVQELAFSPRIWDPSLTGV